MIHTQTNSMATIYAVALIGLLAVIFAVVLTAAKIIEIIGKWKVFSKAGKKGWSSLIPFFNSYVLSQIVWNNGWMFLLGLIPLGGILYNILTSVKLAKTFRKGNGFAVGLVLLYPFFLLALGFSKKSEYQGPVKSGKKATIISSAIMGIGYILLIVLIATVSILFGSKSVNANCYDNYAEADTYMNSRIVLDNGFAATEIPFFSNEDTHLAQSSATGMESGVYVSTTYLSDENVNAETVVMEKVKEELLFLNPQYYDQVAEENIISGNDWAVQKIHYNHIVDGAEYPGFTIIKSEIVAGYPLVVKISYDNYSYNDDTTEVLSDVLSKYKIMQITANEKE